MNKEEGTLSRPHLSNESLGLDVGNSLLPEQHFPRGRCFIGAYEPWPEKKDEQWYGDWFFTLHNTSLNGVLSLSVAVAVALAVALTRGQSYDIPQRLRF